MVIQMRRQDTGSDANEAFMVVLFLRFELLSERYVVLNDVLSAFLSLKHKSLYFTDLSLLF